jgi:aspartyl-tRNA(Asn)/glutamyl-tRNA(Gln) amidotransferase subunit A
MSDLPLERQSISQLAKQIRAGDLSPLTLTEHYLNRIETLDPALHAFKLVCPERALAAAKAAELFVQSGHEVGPLHGIPFAAKDLFDVKGLPTTAGSNLLEENLAHNDATVIRRLRQAGMILLGKTHTVQFAYGGVGINHHHGTPHNPWHPIHHVPGGSSSGSGVAVAAGLAPMALGTDTGGSVRIPAALCGTVGLKTTVGQVSRAGVFPLSWSLDSVGPLTQWVEDAALIYQALQGSDAADRATRDFRPQDVLRTLYDGVKGLRLAFAESVFWDDVDEEVVNAVRACAATFADLQAQVTSIEFPQAAEAQALNPRGLVIAAEAYTIHRDRLAQHPDGFDPIVGQRITLGKDIPAHEYLSTSQAWTELRDKALRTLQDIDALLMPTTMIPALPVEEVDADMDRYSKRNLQYLRNTAIGNILNLCALSIPCGFTSHGLPIGLMIYAKPFHEALLLRIGYAYQQATLAHRKVPDLTWINA